MATQKSARGTTELRITEESGASKWPVRSGLLGLLRWMTESVARVTGVLLLLVIAVKIAGDMWDRPVVIDPLIVPRFMEDRGYTGLVAADRVEDEIARIEHEQSSQKLRTDNFVLASDDEPLSDIEIPATQLSLNTAISLLEDFLHVAPPHASIELIFESGTEWNAPPNAPDVIAISARMPGKESRWSVVSVQNPDEAIKLAARTVLEMINPYALAVDEDNVEHHRPIALQLMQEAAELHPKDTHAYTGWGVILAEEKNYNLAIEKFQNAVALDPKNANAYYNWGSVLYEKTEYVEAIAMFRRAIVLDPRNANAYYNWGNALAHQKDYDGAIAEYRQAIAIDPQYALAYLNWGNALVCEHKYKEAVENYQQGIAIDPQDKTLQGNLEAVRRAIKAQPQSGRWTALPPAHQ
jgi:tetratricopeptide (TPR) repeat protein